VSIKQLVITLGLSYFKFGLWTTLAITNGALMDSNASRRKKIWVEGTTEGVKELHKQILDRAGEAGQVSHISLNETRVTGAGGVAFAIAQERSSLTITPASSNGLIGVGTWNAATEDFYKTFVEPLQDTVGGITTGINYQADNGMPF
jgi:hypothetical protein